jgi:hypothetical protein
VPPVIGVLIRACTLPTTLWARYSVVALAGTVIVVREVHVVPEPVPPLGVNGVAIIEGQHSIVTPPAVTGPLPVMRNLTVLGSGKNWVNPSPIIAAF